jgi:hypothetical protein
MDSTQVDHEFVVKEHEQVVIAVEIEHFSSRVPERGVGFAAKSEVVVVSTILSK